jgi:hypothetical protein
MELRRRCKLPIQQPDSTLFLCFLLGGFAFLYLSLFVLPCAPIFLDGDQAVYLLNAMRMLEGQLIYRDFFQFTTPGTELVYVGLFRLLGPRAWIPHVEIILLGFSLIWVSVEISKKVMTGPVIYLPGLLFLTIAFHSLLDGAHHWHSMLLVMAATAVVMQDRSYPRVAMAGALCGLSFFFTQARGIVALVGFAIFLLCESRWKRQSRRALFKAEVTLCATFLAAVVALSAYFLYKVGVWRFLDCTFIFGIKFWPAQSAWNTLQAYMAHGPTIPPWYHLPSFGAWLFVHALIPFVYLSFLFRRGREIRERPFEPWARLVLLEVVGLSLFIGVAPAPGWERLAAVSLPGFILLGWLVNSPGRLNRTASRMLWALALALLVLWPLGTQLRWRAYLDAPSGRIAFFDRQLYDKYAWILHRTRRSDFFFEAGQADVYFYLGLRNPTGVPYVTATDYTRPEQVRAVIETLEKYRVRFVLWSLHLDVPTGSLVSYHLAPLRTYLRHHYRVLESFEDFDQVWERKDKNVEGAPPDSDK